MYMFIPLKVTTDYSLLQSMITIPKLLLFLKKYQIPACGICDKNLFGVMEFYQTLSKNDIKPIIGIEISVEGVLLSIYAKDYLGYQKLLQLSSKEECTLQDLEGIEEHCKVVLPFLSKDKYSSFSLPNLYIGYSTEYEKNEAYVYTNHVIFCPNIRAFTKKESSSLQMLKAIDTGNPYSFQEKENFEKYSLEYYFLLELEDKEQEEFIKDCNVVFPKNERYIPIFKNDQDSNVYLTSLAIKGLQKRKKDHVPLEYVTRLKYELSVIQKMGFSDYFLIVYDYVKFAKQNDILVGAGRGSAVGSLVSYCLGITNIDPLEYHLFFERFLNPERVTMPDIDIDFEETRRGEVIDYVKRRYGYQCVANIITFGTLKSKLALRCVGKALEINPSVMDSFTNLIDSKKSLKENLSDENIRYYVNQNQDIKRMVEESLKIENLKKHISTHASGVVISSVPLSHIIPIYKNGEELLTGITMDYLEELGLLKMDFLSLTNLTIMKTVLDSIEEKIHQKVDLDHIILDDPNVLNIFTTADTTGVFQFESVGMKNFLKKLKPNCFLDLVSALALYRPGPMENIDTYIKRKEGKEKIHYLHPDLKPILEETMGIIVYQEQIMQILSKMGGFSFAEADTIRRAMSKKKKDVILDARREFLTGAEERGYTKDISIEVFELILKFANYGFNKSHSVSYALVGYQLAYLKCYYKEYFLANLLNRNTQSLGKTCEYIALAKRSGIGVLPPDINRSDLVYLIENGFLRLPFSVIKSLGEVSSKAIVEQRGERPYLDFFDFVARTYGTGVTRKTIESLIEAGAFDSFTTNHNSLRMSIDKAFNYAELTHDLEENFIEKPTLVDKEEESKEEKRKEEYQAFGFYVSNHPSSKYIDPSIVKLENIKEYYGKHVKVVVLLENKKEITTKKGETMAFLTASDETETGNFVVFASVMKELQNIFISDLLLIEGRIAKRYDEYQINVNKIEKLSGENHE